MNNKMTLHLYRFLLFTPRKANFFWQNLRKTSKDGHFNYGYLCSPPRKIIQIEFNLMFFQATNRRIFSLVSF